jgi:hypothetical protein
MLRTWWREPLHQICYSWVQGLSAGPRLKKINLAIPACDNSSGSMRTLLDNPQSVPITSVSENSVDGFDPLRDLGAQDQKPYKRFIFPNCFRRFI